MLSAFYEFLEPVVHELNYWGEKEGAVMANNHSLLNAVSFT